MSDALREVLAEFKIEAGKALAGLSGLDKKLEETTSTFGALTDAFVGSAFVKGLNDFVMSMVDAGSEVNDLADKLGIGTDELQQFQFAAKLVGVSGEEAGKGLQYLNKNLGSALDGNKEAVETFGKLGVAIKDGEGHVRELGDLVPDLADAFQGMGSDAERTEVAMKLFGRSGASLLPLLKQGSEGARAMAQEFERLGGGMSKDFIEAADATGDEIDKLKFGWQGLKSQIVFGILPAVQTAAKFFQEVVGTVRKITRETNLAKESWLVFGAASAAASAKAATGWAKMLGLVPKDASFWSAALGLGEFALVGAAIALVGLAFEDLWTWIQGGDSVIGDVIDSLFGVGSSKAAVDEVRAVFGQLWDEAQALWPLFQLMGEGISWAFEKVGGPALKSFGKLYLQYIKANFEMAIMLINIISKALGDFLHESGTNVAKLGDFLHNEKLQQLGAAVAGAGLKIGAAVAAGAGPGSGASVDQLAVDHRGFGGMGGDDNRHIVNNITVHGVNGPRDTAQAVRDEVVQVLEQDDVESAYYAGDGY